MTTKKSEAEPTRPYSKAKLTSIVKKQSRRTKKLTAALEALNLRFNIVKDTNARLEEEVARLVRMTDSMGLALRELKRNQ